MALGGEYKCDDARWAVVITAWTGALTMDFEMFGSRAEARTCAVEWRQKPNIKYATPLRVKSIDIQGD